MMSLIKRRRGGLLSVVINTRNEETNLSDCLDSVKHCADEIIVVDMQSTDATRKIARRAGARVFSYKNVGYVEPARNFAISKATCDWILLLDADERLQEGERGLTRQLCANSMGFDAFRIWRRNEIFGRWMIGTGWGIEHERHVRLFRRESVTWSDAIHSAPVVSGFVSDIPRPFEIAFDHHNYRTISSFLERLDRYTTQEADILASQGQWSLESMLESTRREFDNRFEPEKDGVHSLILSFAMAFYRFSAHMKQWEREGYPDVRVTDIEQLVEAYLQFEPAGSSRKKESSYALPELSDVPNFLGFYEDEGGWRWMSRFGAIQIPSFLVTGAAIVSFKIRPGPSSHYGRMPVRVIVEGPSGSVHKLELRHAEKPVAVDVSLPSSQHAQGIRLKSDNWFVQETEGSPDRRELSIILSDFEVKPVVL